MRICRDVGQQRPLQLGTGSKLHGKLEIVHISGEFELGIIFPHLPRRTLLHIGRTDLQSQEVRERRDGRCPNGHAGPIANVKASIF